MIVEGNFRLTGLKQTDITPEIINLINSAKDFIVICGYGFTNHSNAKSILTKVVNSPVRSKHCILPITLYKGKDANRFKALHLIQNGVSVSVEEKNHSKWIMSENEIYYGSANFTIDSLEKKIEVATFRTFIAHDSILKEFASFITDSMKRMLSKSNRVKVKGVITKNKQLASQTRNLIKRFNPSIEKVIQTVDSINFVRSSVHEVVENCFWYLNDDLYREITKEAFNLDEIVKSISYRGNELLEVDENSVSYQRKIYEYNKSCDRYLNSIMRFEDLSETYLKKEKKIPSFTKQNRKLTSKSLSLFKV